MLTQFYTFCFGFFICPCQSWQKIFLSFATCLRYLFILRVFRWFSMSFINSSSLLATLQSEKLILRSSPSEVFFRKGVLKLCSKFTGEHPCRNVISLKLLRNVIEITLQHGYSPVILLRIFRTPFLKSTSGRLLLFIFFFKGF